MFEILLTETFARELKKLEAPLRERIKKKLESTKQTPFLFFERLSGKELFKLRIGKYRIIAQISTPKKAITLLSIGHRKKVYEKL
ncbi:MAG: type II toxin-antitoxin system RelE/ParE family toxin [Candidatus ainarchaeum sp.]|nr:type II toxin-antitoxin system RelE/ParE family toxin [Candidatus ainarchaeum sp.]